MLHALCHTCTRHLSPHGQFSKLGPCYDTDMAPHFQGAETEACLPLELREGGTVLLRISKHTKQPFSRA